MIVIEIHYMNGEIEIVDVELDRAGDMMEELADNETIAWMRWYNR